MINNYNINNNLNKFFQKILLNKQFLNQLQIKLLDLNQKSFNKHQFLYFFNNIKKKLKKYNN